MYHSSFILSSPISNNRLNWDERTNHTIVVPSLIEGTLDDVITGEETVIESDVDGKIISGKGLRHFVFLRNAKVPTWIMDNHNHAFAFWHEAFWKGYIQKGSLLVHIDQHTDLATPGNFPAWKHPAESHEALVEEYTNTDLTIADFIVPALATGIMIDTLMITGEERTGVGIFSWENELKKRNSETILENLADYPSIVVDIDLDYFSQGFDEAKTLETTKYWIEKADIITIATSPLFINQKKALEYLHKIL